MKRIIALLLALVCICAVAGCNKLPQPETNLEFWIGENVDDFDFSGFHMKYGMFGGNRYYGTGYNPSLDEGGYQVDPEYCVIYTVTAYPDYASRSRHVTRIEITDPEIELYGLTLNSSMAEIADVMRECGFSVEDQLCCVNAKKGKYSFSFSENSIIISVKVTNKRGIVF